MRRQRRRLRCSVAPFSVSVSVAHQLASFIGCSHLLARRLRCPLRFRRYALCWLALLLRQPLRWSCTRCRPAFVSNNSCESDGVGRLFWSLPIRACVPFAFAFVFVINVIHTYTLVYICINIYRYIFFLLILLLFIVTLVVKHLRVLCSQNLHQNPKPVKKKKIP